MIGWQELLGIALILVLLWGVKRLPGALKGLGDGIREFRRGLEDRD